jgi:membrane dipeptidase
VPDDILARMKDNGGVVMVNFYPGFINGEAARMTNAARDEAKAAHPGDDPGYRRAMTAWFKANPLPPTTLAMVADHIDHLVKVAGVDHVGIGGDFDGINTVPVGLEDVSCYPRLTEELLRRGHSAEDVKKILGGNLIRAFRKAGEVARELQATAQPEVLPPVLGDENR